MVVGVRVHLGPLTPADVRPLACLHQKAFPGFFLSTLGEPFLVQLYLGFLTDTSAVSVVAHDIDGTVQGAVVGTIHPTAFFSRLLRKRWPGFVAASVRATLSNPRVTPRLLRAMTYRGEIPARPQGALLSSICVNPPVRGAGIGRQLIETWAYEVANRGLRTAFLTTDAHDNVPVNNFYQAQGWILSDHYLTREGRSMNCYTKSLEPH